MAGIYIHIPFCHAKCFYCDFYSMPIRNDAEFVKCLENEYHARKSELTGCVDTIYLGGGTPSCIDKRNILRIFDFLPYTDAAEITIEVNPEDADEHFIDWLKENTPVNRVSMGVQSLNDEELKAIGRRHSAAEAITAAHRFIDYGFNLSLDLIYGLPRQTMDSWIQSLDGILDIHPQHLSCYLLSYEPGTKLTAMKQVGKIKEVSDIQAAAMYDILCKKTREQGYEHYEVSNFALPGFRARHNSSYWNMTPYLGLGPGAHSFDGKVRSYNPGNIADYMKNKGVYVTVAEPENDMERFNDFIITSLRTAEGLNLELCRKLFGDEAMAFVKKTAGHYISQNIMWQRNTSERNTSIGILQEHWLTSDAIMVDFIKV